MVKETDDCKTETGIHALSSFDHRQNHTLQLCCDLVRLVIRLSVYGVTNVRLRVELFARATFRGVVVFNSISSCRTTPTIICIAVSIYRDLYFGRTTFAALKK